MSIPVVAEFLNFVPNYSYQLFPDQLDLIEAIGAETLHDAMVEHAEFPCQVAGGRHNTTCE